MAGITGLQIDEIHQDIFNRHNVDHWLMYKFESDRHLTIDMGGGTNWNDMINHLPQREVRYIIVNFRYTSPLDNVERMKRVFLMWAPDGASIRDKLKVTMYSCEAQRLLSNGAGFHVIMQGNDWSDVHISLLLDKIRQNSTVF